MLNADKSACTNPALYSFLILSMILPKNNFLFFGTLSFNFGAISPFVPTNSNTRILLAKVIGIGTLTCASLAFIKFLYSLCAHEKITFLFLSLRFKYLGSSFM